MSAATVPAVYANALLELARERGVTEDVVGASREVVQVLDAQLLRVLDDPRTGKVRAKAVVSSALAAAPREVRELVLLLIDRNRLADAPAILAEVIRQAEVDSGIVHVRFTTAVPVSQALRDQAIDRLKGGTGSRAVIDQQVDPALIGGYTARIGDRYVDASVRRHLTEMKKTITSTAVGDHLWKNDQT